MKITIEKNGITLAATIPDGVLTNPGFQRGFVDGLKRTMPDELREAIGLYNADDQLPAYEAGKKQAREDIDFDMESLRRLENFALEIQQLLDGAGNWNAKARFKAMRQAVETLVAD